MTKHMRTWILEMGQVRIEAPAIVAALRGDAVDGARKAEMLGADLVEVRLDLTKGDPLQTIRRVREVTSLPVIATNRMREEGGAFLGSEEERIELLIEAAGWADLVDVELRSDLRERLTDDVETPVIVSYHDFRSMPTLDELRSLRDEIFDAGADVAKIAATPPGLEEGLDLLRLLLETRRPLCVIGMGEAGRHLRAVAPIYGSVFTYGHVGEETAPGQMSVGELRQVLRALMHEPF